MGYWQEKKEYEEERKDKDFCSICGRALTSKNVKGRCVECNEVVCNNCGKVQEGKIVCLDCNEGKIKWERRGFFGKFFRGVSIELGKTTKNLVKEAQKERKRLKRKKKGNNDIIKKGIRTAIGTAKMASKKADNILRGKR